MKSLIGSPIDALDTPALIVDLDVAEANIARIQRLTEEAGLQMRPHIKSHKTPEFAQMQMRAGAVGITCAKIGEAEVMATAGIEDIFIANCLIGETKMRRLVALAARVPRLSIAVESMVAARAASDAFAAAGLTLPVMIDIDLGAARTGVAREDAVEFTDAVAALPALQVEGLMAYGSHFAYPCRGEEELRAGAAREGQLAAELAAELVAAGHTMRRISGGSTPTAGRYQSGCGLTEVRSGTYIFNDMNQVDIGACALNQVALSVLATVVAHPIPERAIIDAGTKGLDQQVGTTSDGFGWLPDVPGALVYKINDEHGFVDVTKAECDLAIGDKVRVVPPRTPTCLNLYDWMWLVRGGTVVDVWRIAARGRNT